MDPYLSLILPAYNEARVIPTTLGEAVAYFDSRGLSYEIIVAADGADGTREIVRKMAQANPALSAIGSEQRRGKGLGIGNPVAPARGRFIGHAGGGRGRGGGGGAGRDPGAPPPLPSARFIGYADADNKVPIAEFDKVRPLL